ncbi:hypothetical protein BDQ12DRAFT_720053 [Crucibulum laeve]|uniref:Uncharacterized protein n=1 Tax=Crucibulum laeve TaxID=68775 RepID=A0A5C3MC89_9AGAR|nr:hypothetical protein BDQ12DRAFT_720053 [Crucibulum laeve]
MYPPLTTLTDCQDFIENDTPSTVAKRLYDQSLCRNDGIPNLFVHCLPSKSNPIAHAMNEDDSIPLIFSRMRYDSIMSVIINHIAKLEPNPGEIPVHMMLTDDEFNTTLKVLRYFQLPQVRSRVQVDVDAAERVADLVQIGLTTATYSFYAHARPRVPFVSLHSALLQLVGTRPITFSYMQQFLFDIYEPPSRV